MFNQRKFIGSLLITFLFLFVGIASASFETRGGAEVNVPYTFVQTCSDATYMTLDIITTPSGAVVPINENMTLNGSRSWVYNYTPTQLGRYDFLGFTDGCSQSFGTYIIVTPNGLIQSTSQGIGSMMFMFLMIALTFLFGWIGFKLTESKNLWVLGIFFLFLSLLLVVYNVWLGYEYHRNFTGLTDSSMPETIFYIFMFLLVAGFLSSLGMLFLRWKDLGRYIKQQIKNRKEDEEFDKDFED